MKTILFLCSANYYRSRFAEHFFNHLAERRQVPWRADSCGLDVERWGDIGDISHFAAEALEERGIPLDRPLRRPRQVCLDDFGEADLVVAVKEAEHRAMMTAQFPQWANRIEYWQIDDLDCATPDDALPELESRISDLVDRLAEESEAA